MPRVNRYAPYPPTGNARTTTSVRARPRGAEQGRGDAGHRHEPRWRGGRRAEACVPPARGVGRQHVEDSRPSRERAEGRDAAREQMARSDDPDQREHCDQREQRLPGFLRRRAHGGATHVGERAHTVVGRDVLGDEPAQPRAVRP